jgi:RHS repeat-associated protein
MMGFGRLRPAVVVLCGLVAGLVVAVAPGATRAQAALSRVQVAPSGLVAGSSVVARTATSNVFLNPDGSQTLQAWAVPVNYETAGGRWAPIDNSVAADPSLAGGLVNGANSWRVHFGSTGQGVLFDDGSGTVVGMRPLGAADVQPRVGMAPNTVVYPDAWPNVDLQYTVTGAGVQESILLQRPGAAGSFSFAMRSASGSSALGQVTGSLVAGGVPAAGSPVAQTSFAASQGGGLAATGAAAGSVQLGAPLVLTGPNGTPDQTAAPSLGQPGAGQVVMGVDPSWLAAQPASVYPINLDPSIGPELGSTIAGYKADGYSCQCGIGAQVGNPVQPGNPTDYWRSVVSYPGLSVLNGTFIQAATLKATYGGHGTQNQNGMYAHWASAWSYAGAANGAVLASGVSNGVNWADSGLKAQVQSWANTGSYGAIGLVGTETSGVYTYQADNVYLSVTYDHYPNTATGPATSPATSCVTGSGRPYINTTTPTLKASVSDPDGGTLKAAFEIWHTNGAEIGGQNYSASVSSGAQAAWAVPAGNFANGSTYSWRARGYDTVVYSKAYSPWCEFTIDTTAPAAPAITSSTDPSQTTWYTSGAFTGTWTAPSDASGIAGYAVKLDNTATTVPAATVTQTATSYSTTVGSGTWYLHVRAQDKAGNWGATGTYNFHVQTTTATWETPASGTTTGGTVSLQAGSGPSATGATFEVAQGGGAWQTVATTSTHDANYNWTVSWNTAAIGGGGSRLYPNGPYRLGVQLQYSSGPGPLTAGPVVWVGDGPILAGETAGGANPAEPDLNQPATPSADPGANATVDDATGELSVSVGDDHIPGNGLALDLARSYSSTAAATLGAFGYGWASTYSMHVAADAAWGSTVMDVTQENGSVVRFAQDAAGAWQPAGRVNAMLSHDATSGTWSFTRAGGQNKYIFNSAGQLTTETSLDGYSTTLNYLSGKLSSITDPGGRNLTVTWGACAGSSCITAIGDPGNRTVNYTYDSAANLTGVQDVGGAWTHYGYDSAHHLTAITDADTNTTTLTYNTAGQTLTETDPLNHTTSWAYSLDGAGNGTVTATDPLGYVTQYVLAAGQPTTQTGAYGTASAATTSYTYAPGIAAVATKTTAAGTGQAETTAYSYNTSVPGSPTDRSGQTVAYGTPSAVTTTYSYNAADQPTDTTTAAGTALAEDTGTSYTDIGDLRETSRPTSNGTSTTDFAYTTQPGDPASSTTNSQTTNYLYDNYGDQTSATDPLGNQTTYGYNTNLGLKTSMIAARGNVSGGNPAAFTTTYTYDAYGNLITTTNPAGDSTAATFDPLARQLTATDADNHTTTSTYDADGQLTKTTQADGTTVTYSYDADGRKTSETDANGQTTLYTYDPRGNQLTVTDPLGHATTDSYDLNNNQTSETDPDGRTTSHAYNAANQLTQTTQPDTTTLTYTYDVNGNQTSYTDAAGNTTLAAYDALNQKYCQVLPAPAAAGVTCPAPGQPWVAGATMDSYDANGNRQSETNPDGQTTTWTYDPNNKPLTVTYSDGTTPAVSYTYDPDGNTATTNDGTGTTTSTYDNDERATATQNGAGATVGYGYDPAGNVTSLTYPNNQTVTQTYDQQNRLATLTDWNNHTTRIGYDPAGNQTSIAYPNGITDTRTYNHADQLTAITDTTNTTTLLNLQYSPDPAALIASETDTGTSNPGTTNYTYNSLQQLTAAGPTSYSYDHANNLTTAPAGNTQTFNPDSQLCWTATSTGTCPSPPTGATTYTYSNEGNRTQTTPATGNPTSYTWNQTNQLTTLTPPAANPTTYTYDANGLLQTETTSTATTTYTWNTQPGLPLLLADATNYYLYATGTGPIEQINTTTGTTTYLLADQLGSTRAITDSSANVTAAITYDPWGNQTATTGTVSSPFLYADQYKDPASNLYYLRARWYDPQTGQFTSLDPDTVQTNAPYNYAENNPVNRVDPSGESVHFGQICGNAGCFGSDIWGIGNGWWELQFWIFASSFPIYSYGFFLHYTSPQVGNDYLVYSGGARGRRAIIAGGRLRLDTYWTIAVSASAWGLWPWQSSHSAAHIYLINP